MKSIPILVYLLSFCACTTVAWSDEVIVQSFENPGRLVFNESTNAYSYRIEWAADAAGPWYATWSSLEYIQAIGSAQYTSSVPMHYRVVAIFAPQGMVIIPAGSFVMGGSTNVFPGESGGESQPQHTVSVSAFYMDQNEVNKMLWDDVANWAATNGYDIFSGGGAGKAASHPVQMVTWFEAVKWCNARSEKEGLTPCYYTSAALSTVYRNGSVHVLTNGVDWSADGYRLPTEAEWEKAARGGVADTRFPWTDYTNRISHAKANYEGSNPDPFAPYDLSSGYHPTYAVDGFPYTSPVGSFAPNAYGLYDMAGNVYEWCWDWYEDEYYSVSSSNDPLGPGSSILDSRVMRGGSWNKRSTQVSYRLYDDPQTGEYDFLGFRCVRGL